MVPLDMLIELEPYAGMLVDWATNIKYNSSSVAARRTMLKLKDYANRLYIEVRSNLMDRDMLYSSMSKPKPSDITFLNLN